ncbi:hypothetical protein CHLNCDRAFT_50180 [Chlorella variabilis]|uniref:RRM domain-containing protein n=1 Tax=Chlorella variabilis TaxID=554065 RepID=E1Z6V0_CHLVA|nr:hypothetical protein CHLNCDRAFT_50180 [Chlorella variabilis]EFN58712.1 hypothetical protein CHLNCDRAFT_50180 [Chlorella variabilis]|eukprot:XP_005850814.1 hypothetical protein CHLNCDRAFT_50180 [Chlorella variabilis]
MVWPCGALEALIAAASCSADHRLAVQRFQVCVGRDQQRQRQRMGRSRSRSPKRRRSRSRSRERRRSRSRSPPPQSADERHRFLVTDEGSIAAQMQQQQLAALQQQQLQKQLLAQQLMMGGGMGAPGLAMPQAGGGTGGTQAETAARKAREIYIGNLAIGIITPELLREFFDQVFAHQVADPVSCPPVTNVNMDTTGRFAFVEFQTEDMATKALEMDKVELCGRAMNIGRPKGYVAGAPQLPSLPKAAGAAPMPVPVAGQPSTQLLLSNLLPAGQLRGEEERRILQEEVHEEAAKHGAVAAVVVPPPTAWVQDLMPGRCYIKYETAEDAQKGKVVFDGRTLDGNTIKAMFVQEEEFQRAAAGEWVSKQSGVAGIPLPGLYTITPVTSGITGLSALNPSLASLVATNPGIAAMMTAGINDDEVPFEEGYVKLRGFPATVTKADMVAFLKSCGPELAEDDIRLVQSADGTSLGEAFVHFRGPRAKVRLALAKDRSVMPAAQSPIEVLTAVGDDLQRRLLSGCRLV